MITCKPTGFFSWTFRLTGSTPKETASVAFPRFHKQGYIQTSDANYKVIEPGPLGRNWLLEQNGETVAIAINDGRRFTIEYNGVSAVLDSPSPQSKIMTLTSSDGGRGRIEHTRLFKQQLTMDIAGVPFQIQCLAFYLAVQIIREDLSVP